MRDRVMERVSLAARHDFDMLPRSAEIDVQPARHSELSALADMGNRMVPGVQITEPDLERYFAFDPGSILTFSRKEKLLGAVAFLYLNGRGHDALIRDEIKRRNPTSDCLPVAPTKYPPSTSGRSPVMARRWRDLAMYRRICRSHGWRVPISMLNPRVQMGAT